jgi:hypothetical protein
MRTSAGISAAFYVNQRGFLAFMNMNLKVLFLKTTGYSVLMKQGLQLCSTVNLSAQGANRKWRL